MGWLSARRWITKTGSGVEPSWEKGMASADKNQEGQPKLGVFDAISIILGIIIGAFIYEKPPDIFAAMGDPWVALGLWGVCGLLALVGAFCYAELATAYPRSGGDYVYITRAYGPLPGFLYGWSQLAVIQTGSIGMMAYVFANYADRLNKKIKLFELPADLDAYTAAIYAMSAIVIITLLNVLGVVLGKIAQNILTLAKVLGLGAIIVAGFAYPSKEHFEVHQGTLKEIKPSSQRQPAEKGDDAETAKTGQIVVEIESATKTITYNEKTSFFLKGFSGYKKGKVGELEVGTPIKILTHPGKPNETFQVMVVFPTAGQLGPFEIPMWPSISLALVLVFLTYGGWNDAAFVAAEVRDEARNLPRALIFGTIGVIVIYLAVNYAYVHGLGFERAQVSSQPAADMLALLPGDEKYGEQAMCILVMVSALGAVNGLIFTSSRIYATMGNDYSLLAPLGRWSPTLGTPVWSLLLQMLIALSMVVGVGTKEGQEVFSHVIDFILGAPPEGEQHLNWAGASGFDSLVRCTAPLFWLFFLMTGLALFILRINDPQVSRPFFVPLILPIVFCITCGFGFHSGWNYSGKFGLVGLILVAIGFPFYVFSRRSAQSDTPGAA
jgi:amino acid transporter